MYKSRLRNLCQQWWWTPMLYEHTREGLDSLSLFHAIVIVNDTEFRSLDEGARSVKEVHNLTAMPAFKSISALLASPAPPPPLRG
jgi:hypothetical protein